LNFTSPTNPFTQPPLFQFDTENEQGGTGEKDVNLEKGGNGGIIFGLCFFFCQYFISMNAQKLIFLAKRESRRERRGRRELLGPRKGEK
jgi:hypothetical protein